MTRTPLFGVFPAPAAERADAVVEQVLLGDRLGLDLAGIQDHPHQRRHLETWTLLAYLAGRTERIRLFPDVANLPLRSPALLAKAAASLDVLSGGRVELGLGAGAFWKAIAYGPRMLRTVGRMADGWVPSLPRTPLEEIPEKQRIIDHAARAAGRDPGSIRRVANLNGAIVDGSVRDWLHGSVGHCVQELVRLVRDLRFDGFVLWVDDPDVLGQTERFATEIVPAVKEALA